MRRLRSVSCLITSAASSSDVDDAYTEVIPTGANARPVCAMNAGDQADDDNVVIIRRRTRAEKRKRVMVLFGAQEEVKVPYSRVEIEREMKVTTKKSANEADKLEIVFSVLCDE
jgi:hypothetical protein